MSKQITVNVPDNVSYKDPKQLGLGGAKSLSIPQAQGGSYKVAVGGYTKASDTGMGRLASSLQGINQALGAYANMAVKREERSLDELRRMSNEKKRELIGAENKVFRKMGIRPQSILQVKQSLGTAETGRFQAEWQEHLDNVLIPSQAEAGDPLTASQIQQEYTKYRQGWAKDNQFLSKSQLATDGFLAETDGLFDRNSAYYFKSADGYYEQNVQRFSAAEALWAVSDMQPEQFIAEYTQISESMDTSTMRKVIGDMTQKAIQSGDVTYIDKMQSMLGTLGDPANKAKLGSESLANTMQLKLFSLGLDNAETDAEFKGLEKTSKAAGYELEAKQREADKMIAQFRVDYENAKTPEAKRQVQIDFSQTDIYKDTDTVQQAYLLDKLALLEKERNSLETTRRTEEARRDAENTTSVLKPIQDAVYTRKTTEQINESVEAQKKVAQDLFDSGSLSEKAYQDVQGKLHSLGLKTTQDTMLLEQKMSLSERTKVDPELRAANREQNYYSIMNVAKAGMLDKDGNAISIHSIAPALEVTSSNPMESYSFKTQGLNIAARSVFTEYENDIQEERDRLSGKALQKFSPTSNGEMTMEMEEYVMSQLAPFVKQRQAQASQELIVVHERREQELRNKEMLSKGYSIGDNESEFEIMKRFEKISAWEASKEAGADEDMFIFSQDPRTGEVGVQIRTNRFDLDTTEPFSGYRADKHVQFMERYEMLHEADAITLGTGEDKTKHTIYDTLSDESKAQLSSRYKEAMDLTVADYDLTEWERMIQGIDRKEPRLYKESYFSRIGRPSKFHRSNMFAFDESFRDPTYPERQEAIRKVVKTYSLAGVPVEHWRDEDYGGNVNFTLRGPEGDVKSGLGYKNRKELAFVPVETIQNLHNYVSSSQAKGNINTDLQTALSKLPEDEINMVKDALNYFYITGDKSEDRALTELFNNHRAIYSVQQGYNFYK